MDREVSVGDIQTEHQLMEPRQIINLGYFENSGIKGDTLTGILTTKSNYKSKLSFNIENMAPVFRPDYYLIQKTGALKKNL